MGHVHVFRNVDLRCECGRAAEEEFRGEVTGSRSADRPGGLFDLLRQLAGVRHG